MLKNRIILALMLVGLVGGVATAHAYNFSKQVQSNDDDHGGDTECEGEDCPPPTDEDTGTEEE